MNSEMDFYPLISVEGDAYECGYAHGQTAAERVAISVEAYRAAFEKKAGLQWREVQHLARSFLSVIESADRDIAIEMRGIAEGSGHEFDEIVAINCRTEILYGGRAPVPRLDLRNSAETPRMAPDLLGCTTIVALPRATRDGCIVMGKNWDWSARSRESVIILRIRQYEKPALVQVVEAGMVGRDGFNEAGISVNGNLLMSKEDHGAVGVPVTVLRRMILNARRYDEAIDCLVSASRGMSANYLISHSDGVALNLEVTPTSVFTLYPERGLLTHANHFQSPVAQGQSVGVCESVDTLYRAFRARELLEDRLGDIGVEDVMSVLKDHFGYPRSVCRHRDEEEADDDEMTIASLVIEPSAGKMHVAAGPPCELPYREVFL